MRDSSLFRSTSWDRRAITQRSIASRRTTATSWCCTECRAGRNRRSARASQSCCSFTGCWRPRMFGCCADPRRISVSQDFLYIYIFFAFSRAFSFFFVSLFGYKPRIRGGMRDARDYNVVWIFQRLWRWTLAMTFGCWTRGGITTPGGTRKWCQRRRSFGDSGKKNSRTFLKNSITQPNSII